MDRTRHVAGLELGRLPDVDDDGRVRPAGRQLARQAIDVEGGPGLDRPARSAPGAKPTADMADDRLEADPCRLPGEVVEVGLVVDEQDDRPIRVHHPAEPRPERRAGRDRQRARDALVGVGLGRPGVDHERAVAPAPRRARRRRAARWPASSRRAAAGRPGSSAASGRSSAGSWAGRRGAPGRRPRPRAGRAAGRGAARSRSSTTRSRRSRSSTAIPRRGSGRP